LKSFNFVLQHQYNTANTAQYKSQVVTGWSLVSQIKAARARASLQQFYCWTQTF